MSRLEENKSRKTNIRIVLYLIILFGLVYFIFTAGIKMIINSSIFISTIGKKTVVEPTVTQDFSLPPEVLDYPTATNSAKAKVLVRMEVGRNFEAFLNDEGVKKDTVKEDKTELELDLKKGDNIFYVTVSDLKTKIKKNSQEVKISYSDKKPKLEITAPTSGTTISKSEVTVSGQTDPDIEVRINDMPTVLSPEYKFSYSVRLKEGENKIKVVAQDAAGNIEEKEITISYAKD